MKSLVLYGFPFAADIIVSLVLFVGRHALASLGHDEATVGSIVLFYGIGYVIAGLGMARLVKPQLARMQMLGALAGIVAICVAMANSHRLLVIQALYALFPFAVSMFFNSFQIFMLGMSNDDARPLSVTAGHFTFAWSIGYGLGPFFSSLLKATLPWTQSYYLAGIIAGVMGILLLRFRQPNRRISIPLLAAAADVPAGTVGQPRHPPVLIVPAWIGLLAGWTVWTAVLIYWPIQATHMGLPAQARGLVEAVSAVSQGIGALALTRSPRWLHRPGWWLAFGILGTAGLLVLSSAIHPLLFALAALLYGLYTGSMFSALVYHAMVDESKAVQRVAVNETLVGVCLLLGSPLARLLHRDGTAYNNAYLALSALLLCGIVVQALLAAGIRARDYRAASPAL